MMSKNLFWVNLKKDMRRRLWLVVINLLVLFFVLPIAAILNMGQYYAAYAYDQLVLVKTFALSEAIGITNPALLIVSAILAVYSGISGFYYMYNKSTLDFYMSSPVSKKIRFYSIYLNGIAIYAFSYIVNLILALIIGASQSANISSIISNIFGEFGISLLTFFSVYNLTLIAIMLTGNVAISVLGSFTLLFYPVIFITMLEAFCNFFLLSFYTPKSNLYTFDYSPLTIFLMAQSEATEINWSKMLLSVKSPEIFVNASEKVFIIGILFLIIAKLLYNSKPAENCGKAFAYKKAGVVIKVLITLIIAICFGVFFYSVTGAKTKTFMILGLVIGVLFGHCMMQVIINGDLKSTLKGVGSLAVSAIITAALFLTFSFDLLGYDSYVPNINKVESAGFYFPAYWWCSYFDEDGDYVDNEEWIEEKMSLSCLENAIIPLASKRMPGLTPNGRDTDYFEEKSKEYAIISYHMKNGKTIYRKLWFDIYEDENIMNTILADNSFYSAVSALNCENYTSKFDDPKFNLYTQQGFDSVKVENIKPSELFEIYEKDFSSLSFTNMRDDKIVGQISGEYNKQGTYMQNMFPIYESFTNTIAYLEDKGYSIDYRMDPNKVSSIMITNYHSDLVPDNEVFIGESEDYSESMDITDRKQIDELVDYCYPSMINNFWVPKDRFESDYYVEVRTKSNIDYDAQGMGAEYAFDSSYSYQFLTGKVPQFVVDGTAKK